MKKLLLAVPFFLLSASVSVWGLPSVEQVEETTQWQTQTENPRVIKAQHAVSLAYSSYMVNAQLNNLTANEKKIDTLMHAEDLGPSLEESLLSAFDENDFAGSENMTDEELISLFMQKLQDPATQQKQLAAYRANKYIKQLVPLLLANQTQYQAEELDQDTVVIMVVQIAQLQIMETMMQGEISK